jgi:mannose-6-phosphate isomerase-like protein (cupin superfamily)
MSSVVIRTAGQGLTLDIGPTRNTVKLAGAEADGLLGVVEMELGAGFAGPPPHRHLKIDHLWYVLAGRVQATVDGQVMVLAPGDFAFIPHGTPHTFAIEGDEPARLLEMDTPQPLDAYFEELATTFPAGTPVDRATVAAIQRRHDTLPLTET